MATDRLKRVDKAPRICPGVPVSIILCDTCRYPMPLAKLTRKGGYKCLCRVCRTVAAERLAADMRRLAALRVLLRATPRTGTEPVPHGQRERVEHYRRRAAAGLPLFAAGGPAGADTLTKEDATGD